MSAIFGILRFDGGAISTRDLERMRHSLSHRGPDGFGFHVDGPLALGHGLMRANNEDAFEAQPLRDLETNVIVVADCRLDNRNELAAAFGIGASELHALPDSVLLMRAHEKWGENCAGHLLGDFAFAVWDPGARKLLLGRDHMGQRAVHYFRGKDFFAFATEIKALRSNADVPQALSEAQIGRMLMRAGAGNEAAASGIGAVPGGTVMTVGADGSVTNRRYWEPHADPAHLHRDEAYYIDAYRRVLGEAVACRLRRTVRTPGLMFSGGYDSAGIAALAAPVLAASGRKLIAAASVMPADYRGSIRHARQWVEICARDMPHLDVRYVTREGKTVLTGLEREFIDKGGPAVVYHFVHTELLSALAAADAQVIMDGHGGDYTLNPRGRAALAHLLVRFQFRRFVGELRAHLRLPGNWLCPTLKRDVIWPLLPSFSVNFWQRLRHGRQPAWRDQAVNPAFAARLIADSVVDHKTLQSVSRARPNMRAAMRKALERVASDAEPGLAAKAARRGLELTRPFHDKRVVELALAVPQHLYVKDGRNRYLACAALRDIYPREFQNRWRKNDDEIPDFQRMAKSIEPQLLAEIARMEKSENLSRYVDFAKIRALLAARGPDDHNSGWEQETQRALSGFIVARYVEWFTRSNG